MNDIKSGGRLRRGWAITKSSWQVLKLDKELAAIPLLAVIFGLLALFVAGILFIATYGLTAGLVTIGTGSSVTNTVAPGWVNALGVLLIYFVMTLIGNFFSGALIYGATERFNGGDPTVKSSLAGARRKFYPLAIFSLMMATIGLAFQALEERVPFAGRIAVWLLSAAWSVANIFAVPVIVLSEGSVKPLDATKQSVAIIKQVWGESVVANIGIGLIGVLAVSGYWVGVIVLGFVGSVLHLPVAVGVAGATIAVIGFLILALGLSALSSIAKAALYHYATTGEAPESFNRELLHAAVTPKKARKIFG
jgi:hypothetical protein